VDLIAFLTSQEAVSLQPKPKFLGIT